MSNDAALLSLYVQARDPEAFRQLIDRHGGLVFGTCLRICGNRADADDAVQEVFIELARVAGRIHGSLPAWLHTVSQRTSWRILRRRSQAVAQEPVAAQPDAVRALLPHLDAAIAALPADERQCIVLRYLEGRTQAEIAAETGLSQPTVHRRLAAAAARLRERLGATETSCGAVLLAAHPPVPPEVSAGLGKVALIGPASASGLALGWIAAGAMAAVLVAGAAIAIGVPRTPPPSPPPPQVVAGDAPASPPSPSVPATAPRLATVVVHDLPVGEVIALINAQSDLRVELHPALLGDPARITVDCEGMPAADILTRVVAQVPGWRVRRGAAVLGVDRQASIQTVQRVLPWAASVRAAMDSGDWDLAATLTSALGDGPLDRQSPAVAQALQDAVLHGLGELGATQEDWLWTRRGSEVLDRDPRCPPAIAAALARCQRLGFAPTPLLIHVAGLWHATAAVPLLQGIARDPWPWFPGYARSSAFQAGYVERCRESARWALGRLGVLPGHDGLAQSLRDGGDFARLTSLRLLAMGGDRDLIAAQVAQQGPVWIFNAERFAGVMRWMPDILATRPTGTAWDLGDVCGSHATTPLLRALISQPPATQEHWYVAAPILEASGHLDAAAIRAACADAAGAPVGGRLGALLAATAGDLSRLADIDAPGALSVDIAGPLLTRLPAAVRARIRTQVAWPAPVPDAAAIDHDDAAFVAHFYDGDQVPAIAARLRAHCPGPGAWWGIYAIDWDRNPCPLLAPEILDACADVLADPATPTDTARAMATALMGRVIPFDTGDHAQRLIPVIMRIAQATNDAAIATMIAQWRQSSAHVNNWERIYEQALLRGRWDDAGQLAKWDALTVASSGSAASSAATASSAASASSATAAPGADNF